MHVMAPRKRTPAFQKQTVRFRNLFLDGVDVDDAYIMEEALDNYKFSIKDHLSKITQNSNFHHFFLKRRAYFATFSSNVKSISSEKKSIFGQYLISTHINLNLQHKSHAQSKYCVTLSQTRCNVSVRTIFVKV